MNQNRIGFSYTLPPVTKNLLIINILCFIAQIVLESKGIDLVRWGGLHYMGGDTFLPHQLITSMFLHGSFWHLFSNMFALFMFGPAIEQVWGSKKFLTYYMVTGIGAGLIQSLSWYIGFEVIEQYPPYILNQFVAIGASGAIFGILLAFAMTFPNATLVLIPIPIPIKAKYFVAFYALYELYSGISNKPEDNVAHFAHLGGLIFGLILILYWRRKNKNNGFNLE